MIAVGTCKRSSCRSPAQRVSWGRGRPGRRLSKLPNARRVTSLTAPLVLLMILVAVASAEHGVRQSPASQEEASRTASRRPKYQINLALDFDHRSYKGSERVRWTNRGEHAVSSVFFHLYANVRTDQQPPARATPNEVAVVPDEPRIEVSEVKSA